VYIRDSGPLGPAIHTSIALCAWGLNQGRWLSALGIQVSAQPLAAGAGSLIKEENIILKIPNLKHHLILKLGQIYHKFQYSMTETGLKYRSLASFE